LPEGQRQAQEGERSGNCVGEIHRGAAGKTQAVASAGLASMRSSRTSTPCGGMS
jgi:hypothetical protein